MAIVAGDLFTRLTVATGSAGNTVAQPDPNASLGTKTSSTAWLNNGALFDDISGAENAASTIDYRCIAIHNAHATLAWQTVVAWISAETAGGASINIGADPAAAAAVATAAFSVSSTETTTPTPTVTFPGSTPTTLGGGLAMGTINAGFAKGLWFKRSAANTAALTGDGFTLSLQGDTNA